MFGRNRKGSIEPTLQINTLIESTNPTTDVGVVENEQEISYNEAKQMSEDLMRCMGEAIDKWSALYGLESMPKNMVFNKVLTIMNAWDKTKVFR